jgi:hypothetical protein
MEFFICFAIVTLWLMLQLWVLPRFGVQAGLRGAYGPSSPPSLPNDTQPSTDARPPEMCSTSEGTSP